MPGNPWDDHYARRARKEQWRARSIYKLEEIDRKFRLIRKGDRLLDLGCSPGSWSQYGLKKIGPQGHMAGIDLTRPDDLHDARFQFIQGDVFAVDLQWLSRRVGPRDGVFSDMAPRTTGSRVADVNRSMALAQRALDVSRALLAHGGKFVCKVFEGEDLKPFRDETVRTFRQVRTFRPAAVRKGSREVYVIGIGFTGTPRPGG